VKIQISPSGVAGVRVAVQRTARHTRAEAYELSKELAHELAATAENWTLEGPTRTPRPPKDAPSNWAPRGLFVLRLPVKITEVSPGYRVNEPLVIDPAERRRLVEVVEEVAGQYVEKVDALNMVRWIMEPRFGYACPDGARLGASAQDRAPYDAIALEREAWRLELLAPYIAGKHPVRHTELFAEFQTDFSILERAVIRAVAWGDTNKMSATPSYGQNGSESPTCF